MRRAFLPRGTTWLVLLGLGAAALSGCGPSQKTLDEQDRQVRQAYERRSVAPPKKGRLSEIHQKRLEFEFGGERPESGAAGPPKSSTGR